MGFIFCKQLFGAATESYMREGDVSSTVGILKEIISKLLLLKIEFPGAFALFKA